MLDLLLIHTAGQPSVHYQPTLHLYSHHRHHRNDHFHYYQGQREEGVWGGGIKKVLVEGLQNVCMRYRVSLKNVF